MTATNPDVLVCDPPEGEQNAGSRALLTRKHWRGPKYIAECRPIAWQSITAATGFNDEAEAVAGLAHICATVDRRPVRRATLDQGRLFEPRGGEQSCRD